MRFHHIRFEKDGPRARVLHDYELVTIGVCQSGYTRVTSYVRDWLIAGRAVQMSNYAQVVLLDTKSIDNTPLNRGALVVYAGSPTLLDRGRGYTRVENQRYSWVQNVYVMAPRDAILVWFADAPRDEVFVVYNYGDQICIVREDEYLAMTRQAAA